MVYFLFCLKKRWRIFLNAPVFGVILNHGFSVLVNISIRLQTQQAIERRIHMMHAIFFLNSGPLRFLCLCKEWPLFRSVIFMKYNFASCFSVHHRNADDSFGQNRTGVSCAELYAGDIHQHQRSAANIAVIKIINEPQRMDS